MKVQTYEVSLIVNVFDPEALAKAAEAKALESMTAEEWADLRDEDHPIQSDLTRLLDPGVSPAGTQIEDSSCEFWNERGDEEDGE